MRGDTETATAKAVVLLVERCRLSRTDMCGFCVGDDKVQNSKELLKLIKLFNKSEQKKLV